MRRSNIPALDSPWPVIALWGCLLLSFSHASAQVSPPISAPIQTVQIDLQYANLRADAAAQSLGGLRVSGRAADLEVWSAFMGTHQFEPLVRRDRSLSIQHGYTSREHTRGLIRQAQRPSAAQSLHQQLSSGDPATGLESSLAIIQGSYYLVTGVWPILHMRSFEQVTGPKTDHWLVQTVGALIAVTGGVLLVSGLGDGPSDDLKLAAAGSAAALAAVDITFVAQGRISRIYLLDAAAEIALVIGWGITLLE